MLVVVKIQNSILACFLACTISLPLRSLALDLPNIGGAPGAVISTDEERHLGEELMRRIHQSLLLIEDPEITEYIQSLGYQLVAHSDAPSQNFTFFIINDASINAFAAPGGFIGINSGLILATESESELASVMAHEIVHITQRHLARAIEKANKMNLPATAALIAAIILAGKNTQIGQAAIMSTMAGNTQNQLNFTRAHEQEADRLGMEILASAGFNPQSMPTFFEKLQQASRFYDNKLPELLKTHPVTESRIADSRNRAEQYSTKKKFVVNDAYRLVQVKLRVLTSENPNTYIKNFEDTTKINRAAHGSASAVGGRMPGAVDAQGCGRYGASCPSLDTCPSLDGASAVGAGCAGAAATITDKGTDKIKDYERYGYALALLAANRYSDARGQIEKLLAKEPEKIPYIIVLAKLDMADKHLPEALQNLSVALDIYPHNHPLTITYANALLEGGQAQAARILLKEQVRRIPDDPALYTLLARAEGDAGYKADSHQSLAEHYYLTGEMHAAIEQLNIALRLTQNKDFYRTSRIEARLKQLQAYVVAETKR